MVMGGIIATLRGVSKEPGGKLGSRNLLGRGLTCQYFSEQTQKTTLKSQVLGKFLNPCSGFPGFLQDTVPPYPHLAHHAMCKPRGEGGH